MLMEQAIPLILACVGMRALVPALTCRAAKGMPLSLPAVMQAFGYLSAAHCLHLCLDALASRPAGMEDCQVSGR